MDVRKRLSMQKVVEFWPRLPREVVSAPNLTEFKKQLDKLPLWTMIPIFLLATVVQL